MRGGVTYERIDDAGLHITEREGRRKCWPVDHVIICAGQESVNGLATELAGSGKSRACDRRRAAGGRARCRTGDSRSDATGGEVMRDNPSNKVGDGDSPHFQLELLSVEGSGENGGSPLSDAPCIRVSHRARRLAIRVYPDARVEVVVPPRARPREVEHFLAAHREWIESKRAQALRNRPAPEAFPPASLRFALTGETLAGARGRWVGKTARWRTSAAASCRCGGTATPASLRTALRRWLLQAAEARLAPRLECAGGGHRRDLPADFRPPAALALGKLFGARYHQSQLPACSSSGPKWSTTSSCTSSCTSIT